jgi:hypothetical protein
MEGKKMDYGEMTAPCGLDCFNCPKYLAIDHEPVRTLLESQFKERGLPVDNVTCRGCRNEKGACVGFGAKRYPCKVYKCVMAKGIESCADCSDFPCDNLQPFAEHAQLLPHNMKVYNLALIRKMGVEKWAQEKAKQARDVYFNGKFDI